MKRYTITNAEEIRKLRNEETLHLVAIADGTDKMEVSDGYHTMDELYEHRFTIFIALCKYLFLFKEATNYQISQKVPKVWRSKLHSDGTAYDGWFILGIGKEKEEQITYHLPLEKWDDTEFAETLEKAPEWDGHTPADVLERIKTL